MRPTRTVTGLLLILAACQDAATAPESPLPQGLTADLAGTAPAEATAQRIGAITQMVLATNARVGDAMVAWPPNPCTEISPLCDAAARTNLGYHGLGEAVALLCEGGTATAGTLAPDLEAALAAPYHGGGAGRLISAAAVLDNALHQLAMVQTPSPGAPEEPVAGALNALGKAVFDGGSALAGWLGGGFDFPPNPCTAP